MTRVRGRSLGRRSARLALAAALLAAGQATFAQSAAAHGEFAPRALAADLAGAAPPQAVMNHPVPGTLERRDQAVREWRQAVARYRRAVARARVARGPNRQRLQREARRLAPDPFAKPEYLVVWMAKANAADENYRQVQTDAGHAAQEPAQAVDDAPKRFVPGLDGWAVLDARRRNVDGSRNPHYGKVQNFVQIPPPWGVGAEAHHMQYQWQDGDPLLAGGLFNTSTFVADLSQIPKMNLLNAFGPQDTPNGTIPDAYDAAGGGAFIGTYMGGPEPNYGGSPGEVVAFRPDPKKGLVVASETPAGTPGATEVGENEGGVPEVCNSREGAPAGTCANPHGIQIRPDLGRMVTSDYGEPKAVVLDPVKFDGGTFFRPTVRTWDTSNPLAPKLLSVAHMPIGWRDARSSNGMHLNRGIMENAKTWPRTPSFPNTLESKGFFAGSMCGGGIFFTPDVTKHKGDATDQWRQVWDDGLSLSVARGGNVEQWIEDEGPCQGGAWMQVSRNNNYLFRAVMGNQPSAENYTTNGQPNKILYNLDISPLIRAAQTGRVRCDVFRGTDLDGDRKVDLEPRDMLRRMHAGEQVADCPRLVSTLNVDDKTTGGPHWAALDNQSLTADGTPTRLAFSNYFVARSGVDGNHRLYSVNIDPRTGRMSYDNTWRDEVTGQVGTNFNRTGWPGNPNVGFYKPHSMVWACPPGICPADKPAVGLR